MSLCHVCGQPTIGDSKACDAPKCAEASARILLAKVGSRGYPLMRKGWQTEGDRVRKQVKLRLLPSAHERLQRYAASQRTDASSLVERWILSLPSE